MSSSTTFHYEIWERRWEAVTATMKQMLATMKNQPAQCRQQTLESVLTALLAFGDHQVNFFLDGFGRKGKVFLEPSTLYPPDYVLSATLNQLMHDLNVIGRAWEQRCAGLAAEKMPATLSQADQVANGALAPAIDHGLIDPAIVVTYFQKDTNVRIIPYAPVSFIGLPLTSQEAPRDLLAIPHEVGHYVYRYGRVRSGKNRTSRFDAVLPQRYSGQAAWRAAWMEEIFADVYGALVGGAVMASGFEDLLSASPREHFIHDDGEHPVGALRLGIYLAVFEKIGVDPVILDALKVQRTELAAAYGNPTTFVTTDGVEVDLKAAENELTAIVHALLDNDLAGFHPTPPWQGTITAPNVLAALDEQFTAYVEALPGKCSMQLADLHLNGEQLVLQPLPPTWLGKPVTRIVGATQSWIDLVKAAFHSHPTITLPPRMWMALFDGSGWATEGPTGGSTHE